MKLDSGRSVRRILFNVIVAVLTVGSLVFFVWALRPLILPTILGVLLAYLFKPLRSAFKYRWLPNGIRIGLLLLGISASVLSIGKLIKDNIPDEKEKLEIAVRMKYKFNQRFDKLMGIDPATGKGNTFYNLVAQDINPLRANLNNLLELNDDQKARFSDFCEESVEGFEPVPAKYCQYFSTNVKKRDPASIPVKAEKTKGSPKVQVPEVQPQQDQQSLAKMLISIVSIWFLMPIVFIFFLLDDGQISRFFIRLVPNRYFELALSVLEEVDSAIGKYLRGISLECTLVGVTMSFGLLVVGFPIQMALMIGVLSGLATAIPLVGPVVGLSLSLTYALIAEEVSSILPFIDMDNIFVAVLIINGIVIALDNIVFQPIVLGSAVNLHPLVVILGIMAGSMIFGMAGVLLAIPTIVVLKSVIQHTFRGLKDYRII